MKLKTRLNDGGFTLIELMIVIAIIGILAAVAVPQYEQFTNRAYVSGDGLSAARPFQQAVNEYYFTNQRLPSDATALRLANSGKSNRVASAVVASDSSAKITVLFKTASEIPRKIRGLNMVLAPQFTSTGSSISWTVDTNDSTLPDSYLPSL